MLANALDTTYRLNPSLRRPVGYRTGGFIMPLEEEQFLIQSLSQNEIRELSDPGLGKFYTYQSLSIWGSPHRSRYMVRAS